MPARGVFCVLRPVERTNRHAMHRCSCLLFWVLTGITNASTATVSSHVLFCLRPAAAQAPQRTAQTSELPAANTAYWVPAMTAPLRGF